MAGNLNSGLTYLVKTVKSNDHKHFLNLNAGLLCRFQLLLGYRGRKSLEQSNYQIDSWLRASVCWFHFSGTNTMDYWHGLRTPNEGINQSYLKNWADVADKICFGPT